MGVGLVLLVVALNCLFMIEVIVSGDGTGGANGAGNFSRGSSSCSIEGRDNNCNVSGGRVEGSITETIARI